MNAYLTLEPTAWDRRLGPMVFVSLAVHALFTLAILFWPMGRAIPVGMRFMEAELVPGVPVAPVPRGVPEGRERYVPPDAKEAKDEQAPPPKPEPPPAKSSEMKLPVANPTARQKDADKDRAKMERQMDSAVERIRSRKQVNQQFGDPEGTPGTQADYGQTSMQSKMLMLYLNKIKQAVSENWVLPPGISANAKIKVVVFFRLDARGGIFDAKLDRSSGYAGADQTCLQAFKKAAPFPPPPPSIAPGLQTEGIALIFQPGGKGAAQ